MSQEQSQVETNTLRLVQAVLAVLTHTGRRMASFSRTRDEQLEAESFREKLSKLQQVMEDIPAEQLLGDIVSRLQGHPELVVTTREGPGWPALSFDRRCSNGLPMLQPLSVAFSVEAGKLRVRVYGYR